MRYFIVQENLSLSQDGFLSLNETICQIYAFFQMVTNAIILTCLNLYCI
jgi:hypothetical protein